MGCQLTVAHHHALQVLYDHGSLTVEQLSDLLWPDAATDRVVAASLLAHLIAHGWVAYHPPSLTFALTTQARDVVRVLGEAPAALNAAQANVAPLMGI